MFGGEVFQNVSRRRPLTRLGFLASFQRHFVEQNCANLSGALNIEFSASEVVKLRLQSSHLLAKGVRHPRQGIPIHLHTSTLHLRQNRDKRSFQGFINGRHPLLMKLRFEKLPQSQRDICVLSRIPHGILDRDTIKRDSRFPCPQ